MGYIAAVNELFLYHMSPHDLLVMQLTEYLVNYLMALTKDKPVYFLILTIF